MSNEATIRSSIDIQHTTLKYRSYPTDFQLTVSTEKGPMVGAIQATLAGTSVGLTEVTTPGLMRVRNLDATNYVTLGIWDGLEFHPFMEVGPGEHYVIKLPRELTETYGTGTGTIGIGEALQIKANTAACNVLVEIFEK